MPQRIRVVVQNHFGITGSAAAEKHQQRIGNFVIRRTGEFFAETGDGTVEIQPVFAVAFDDDFQFHRRCVFRSFIHAIRYVVIRCGDDHFYLGTVETVLNIFGKQLIRCRDRHRTDAVQGVDDIPVLMVPFEDQQDFIALLIPIEVK